MDKEFEVLEYISSSDDVTQRDISEHLGISLGSVNLLLKKMIKEGFIKIEKIPANRVAYMLTPKGIQEKVLKTFSYIKIHYNAIEKYKDNMKILIDDISKSHDKIYVYILEKEIRSIFSNVLSEYEKIEAVYIDDIKNINIQNNICIVDQNIDTIYFENVYNIKEII